MSGKRNAASVRRSHPRNQGQDLCWFRWIESASRLSNSIWSIFFLVFRFLLIAFVSLFNILNIYIRHILLERWLLFLQSLKCTFCVFLLSTSEFGYTWIKIVDISHSILNVDVRLVFITLIEINYLSYTEGFSSYILNVYSKALSVVELLICYRLLIIFLVEVFFFLKLIINCCIAFNAVIF